MEDYTKPIWTSYSEFEIHAEAYLRLKQAGFNVRGDYAYYDPDYVRWRTKHIGRERKWVRILGRKARFDLVILNEMSDILLIIEVKKRPRTPESTTFQADLYQKITGQECIYIRGIEEAVDVVSTVKAVFDRREQESTPATEKIAPPTAVEQPQEPPKENPALLQKLARFRQRLAQLGQNSHGRWVDPKYPKMQ